MDKKLWLPAMVVWMTILLCPQAPADEPPREEVVQQESAQELGELEAEMAKIDQQIAELQRQRAGLAMRIKSYRRMIQKAEVLRPGLTLRPGLLPGSQPSHLKFPVDVERAMMVPSSRVLERSR